MFYTVINAPVCHALNSAEQSFLFVDNYFDTGNYSANKFGRSSYIARAILNAFTQQNRSQTKIVIVKACIFLSFV